LKWFITDPPLRLTSNYNIMQYKLRIKNNKYREPLDKPNYKKATIEPSSKTKKNDSPTKLARIFKQYDKVYYPDALLVTARINNRLSFH
jgi:hypothetical protein